MGSTGIAFQTNVPDGASVPFDDTESVPKQYEEVTI